MMHFSIKRTVIIVALALVMLTGCGRAPVSSSVTSAPVVNGDLELPAPVSSDTPVSVAPSSDVSSEETSSDPLPVKPPKTSDAGTPMTLTVDTKTALETFINRSVAAYSSFEAADEIDDVLVVSGMVLCTQENRSRVLDDGTYGVEADKFEQIILDYFGRRIEYPGAYEGDTGEIQYDGEYYRWYGGGFEPGMLSVVSAEDMGNGYIKCNISGIMENEDGEQTMSSGSCILKETADSPYGYNFIASAMNG